MTDYSKTMESSNMLLGSIVLGLLVSPHIGLLPHQGETCDGCAIAYGVTTQGDDVVASQKLNGNQMGGDASDLWPIACDDSEKGTLGMTVGINLNDVASVGNRILCREQISASMVNAHRQT